MSERDQQEQIKSEERRFSTAAYGDTANEIELAALDEARAFFGADVRMEIEPDYHVGTSEGHGEATGGKRYYSHISIRVIGE